MKCEWEKKPARNFGAFPVQFSDSSIVEASPPFCMEISCEIPNGKIHPLFETRIIHIFIISYGLWWIVNAKLS